jgi:hypothetical protein
MDFRAGVVLAGELRSEVCGLRLAGNVLKPLPFTASGRGGILLNYYNFNGA